MTKSRRLATLAALGATFGLTAAGASPAEAATCNPKRSSYPGSGYYLQLKATKISCGGAYDVRAAHYKCRTRKGKTGRCSGFSGWRCSESRNAGSVNYIGKVTCRKSGRTVYYVYEQDK